MKAIQVHRFGPPEVMRYEDASKPEPGEDEVLVKVKAAGVGLWDAAIRSGRSARPQPLPVIPGAELSGVVESVGRGVESLKSGDEVFGATGERFVGAYAEYAVAKPETIALKPATLNHVHAASVPVAAVAAWQMVFDHARVAQGQTVLVHGAAGNVGAYAVQLAKQAGALVIGTASGRDAAYARSLGADGVIDYRTTRFEEKLKDLDAVIDTAGGETLERSYALVKRGGVIVSSAAAPSQEKAKLYGARAVFFAAEVTSERLKEIARLIDLGRLKTEVGEVLWLHEARRGHQMLEGAPRRRGKIVIMIPD